MADDNGKVVYPSKFQQMKDKTMRLLGLKVHEPTMYLDHHALMMAFRESDVFKAFARMYPEHDRFRWQFDVVDGEVRGVFITQQSTQPTGETV